MIAYSTLISITKKSVLFLSTLHTLTFTKHGFTCIIPHIYLTLNPAEVFFNE